MIDDLIWFAASAPNDVPRADPITEEIDGIAFL